MKENNYNKMKKIEYQDRRKYDRSNIYSLKIFDQSDFPNIKVKYNPILYYSNFLSPKRAFLISFS